MRKVKLQQLHEHTELEQQSMDILTALSLIHKYFVQMSFTFKRVYIMCIRGERVVSFQF